MSEWPATYLELRAVFLKHKITFAHIGSQVTATKPYTRNTLMTFWGRTDLAPSGVKNTAIIQATRELLRSKGYAEPELCTVGVAEGNGDYSSSHA